MRRRRSWTRQASHSLKTPSLILPVCLSTLYGLGTLAVSKIALAPSTPFLAALLFATIYLGTLEGLCLTLVLGLISDLAAGNSFNVFSICFLFAFFITRLIQPPLNLASYFKILPLSLVYIPTLALCKWIIFKFLSYQVPSFFSWVLVEGVFLNLYEAGLLLFFVSIPHFIFQKMGLMGAKEKKSL